MPLRSYVVTEIRSIEVRASSPAEAVKKGDEQLNPTAETLAKRRPLKEPRVVSISATDVLDVG